MTITYNSLSGILLIFVSFNDFSEVLFFRLEHIPVSSFCLTFSVYFYVLGRTATSPNIEGVASCIVIPCVDRVCLVTLAGGLELWLGCGLGIPGQAVLGLLQ